jgi:hypothetical protein
MHDKGRYVKSNGAMSGAAPSRTPARDGNRDGSGPAVVGNGMPEGDGMDEPELDERLRILEGIRDAFRERSEAGEPGASTIIRAVDEMIDEARELLSPG